MKNIDKRIGRLGRLCSLSISIIGLGSSSCSQQQAPVEIPNIIYILADDLGYGDLGSYGQQIIRTPHLDRLAAEGMIFTQHYAGSTVCAPSRSSLMTGQHTGNTPIRGNRPNESGGQHPLSSQSVTIAEILKSQGYTTGAFGKWGLGMHDNEGSPLKQGFDTFFGYLCQLYAHRYYPPYLWKDDQKYHLEGNNWEDKVTYSQDVIQEKTLEFIKGNKDRPFFLYVAHLIPHAELVVPEDSLLNMYLGKFPETPWGFEPTDDVYQGNAYGADNFHLKGYAPVKYPRATFAAMVSRLDYHVGQIMDLLEELGIRDNTLIIFSSDNGPHQEGGADPDFFNSNGPLRGYKRDLYEGGIRVPMIASWPAKIEFGTVTDHISAFWDIKPTIAEVAGVNNYIENIDGISFLPVLRGAENQQQHDYLYWEFPAQGGKIAVRKGDWKAVRNNAFSMDASTLELYNLRDDLQESINVAVDYPEIVMEMKTIMKNARTESDVFDFPVIW
jgi:arylsulfatase A-like enzyme